MKIKMNKKVNIGGDPNDPSYRYKRDTIVVQKVSGAKQITNWPSICKQLRADSNFTNAFYSEIKRKGNVVFKNGLFKGSISAAELEAVLDKLIAKYILCPNCKLPEWDGTFCTACGESQESKTKKEDEDERECTHMSEAVKHAKSLYKLRSEGVKEADEILEIFWKLQTCVDNGISEKRCIRGHEDFCSGYLKWRASLSN